MGVKYKKDKGNYLENKVAKMFQTYHKLSKHDVHRAQASGNFITEYGDLYFKDYNIIVECKNQASFNFTSIFPEFRKNVQKSLDQLEKEYLKFKNEFPEQPVLKFLVISDSSKRFGPFVITDSLNLKQLETSYMVVYYDEKQYFVQSLDTYIENINIKKYKR